MFTGIVTDVGVIRVVDGLSERRFEVSTRYDTAAIPVGSSICCSGVCLTVTDTGDGWFSVFASAETLARTTLGDWREGTLVNLERSLRVGDEMGGHFVSGHVDGVGKVLAVTADGASRRLAVEAPEALKKFIAVKGSIAVDGVSLTVNEVAAATFGVNVIPHTLAVTTLDRYEPGARVNLEIDVVARYVARCLEEGHPRG
jgi:riboflavin synthase